MSERVYRTAIYARLSKDDGDKAESNSIVSQKSMCEEYIEKHIDLELVERVISQLGMPDGSSTTAKPDFDPKAIRRLYRDTDDVRIAGVCSGLALYFGIDTALMRIIMLVALIAGSAGFWIYLILWIAVPKATTPAQKCELRGLAPTASNMARFSSTYNRK